MKKKQDQWVIGMISKPSISGIDVACLKTNGEEIFSYGPTCTVPYTDLQRQEIKSLVGCCVRSESVLCLEQAVTAWHAYAAKKALDQFHISIRDVCLIGAYGHTLAHFPKAKKTLQILDGKALASYIGVPVVYDFHTLDVMHGGYGAPLSPIFYFTISADYPKPILFLDISQVSTMTFVSGYDQELYACDIGIGMKFIDNIISEFQNTHSFSGNRLSGGKINMHQVKTFFHHPFFDKPIPKFVDYNAFHVQFELNSSIQDRIATAHYIIAYAAYKILDHLPTIPKLCVVSGDGIYDKILMYLLRTLLPFPVQFFNKCDNRRLDAYICSFLAMRVSNNLPTTFPTTTGCTHSICGGEVVYPYQKVK